MSQPAQKASIENYSVSPLRHFRLRVRRHGDPLRVLSEQDWEFWKENGYVVVASAVPEANVRAVVELLWMFQEMDPNDPETWYRNPANKMQMDELINSGMVEVYNHQALWNNRQHPKIYDVFVDIWGTQKLWVSIDRANLNPPVRPGWAFSGFIHWDVDTSLDPLPVNVQGVLALTDTSEETGGFQCVPDIFRNFHDWVKTQPRDRDPWKPDVSGFQVRPVLMHAGDLLIWNSLLPHGIRPNRSKDKIRMAQYITMSPAQEENAQLVEWRMRSWKERIAPTGQAFPADPRGWEQKHQVPAKLTVLGEKLLGLTKWDAS